MFSRLLVSDIAPVIYQQGNEKIAEATATLKLTPSLTRRQADAVPRADIRAFLLQNLHFGASPTWRIGLQEIATAVPDLEGWADLPDTYPGPSLFATGANFGYVLPEHRPSIRALFPTARFVAIKDAGHWVHADNPSGFLSVLEAFLHNWT